jgi:hypothetical protein
MLIINKEMQVTNYLRDPLDELLLRPELPLLTDDLLLPELPLLTADLLLLRVELPLVTADLLLLGL